MLTCQERSAYVSDSALRASVPTFIRSWSARGSYSVSVLASYVTPAAYELRLAMRARSELQLLVTTSPLLAHYFHRRLSLAQVRNHFTPIPFHPRPCSVAISLPSPL